MPIDDSTPIGEWIVTPYITKNGMRIYPKTAKFFRFFVPRAKVKNEK
jgi:hypothetical protein